MNRVFACGAFFAAFALATGSSALAQTAPVAPAQSPAPMVPVAPAQATPNPSETADGLAGPAALKQATDASARLTLAVMINGQGPFDFLIDTGSDRTVISKELAARLKLDAGPDVVMHESVGVDTVQTVVIPHLAIGDRTVDHIEAPALAAADLGADGMLGVDALRNLHVVMDFKAMRLTSTASRPEFSDGHTIVVRGMSRFGQLVLVDAEIRGVRIYVVLDSGSQLSVGNPALLRLLTGKNPSKDPLIKAQLISVTGRKLDVELDDIAEAHIGGLEIRNMPLAFAQLHTFDRFGLTNQPALLLGMDVLSQCQKVSVDLRRREATFTVN